MIAPNHKIINGQLSINHLVKSKIESTLSMTLTMLLLNIQVKEEIEEMCKYDQAWVTCQDYLILGKIILIRVKAIYLHHNLHNNSVD